MVTISTLSAHAADDLAAEILVEAPELRLGTPHKDGTFEVSLPWKIRLQYVGHEQYKVWVPVICRGDRMFIHNVVVTLLDSRGHECPVYTPLANFATFSELVLGLQEIVTLSPAGAATGFITSPGRYKIIVEFETKDFGGKLIDRRATTSLDLQTGTKKP